MIIGFDASKASSNNKTGVEFLVYQLLLELKKIDQENKYLLYSPKSLPSELLSDNFKEILIPFPKFWNTIRLPIGIFQTKPDIFISPANPLPSHLPCKTIAIIHDLACKYFPEAYTKKELYLMNKTYSNAAKASGIVFVSENTQEDFLKFYPKTKSKSIIMNLSYNQDIFSDLKENDTKIIKNDYILVVGRLESRKNTTNVIKSFEILKNRLNNDLKLVLVGKPGSGFNKIEETIRQSKFTDDIIVKGYVEQDELINLYQHASLFLFATLYEGFGIPILEAMASGIPVVTSTSSSMPAVAGEAALLVDPQKPTEIALACEKVLLDPLLKSDMIKKGKENIKKYSWQRSAEKLLELIEKI